MNLLVCGAEKSEAGMPGGNISAGNKHIGQGKNLFVNRLCEEFIKGVSGKQDDGEGSIHPYEG